MSDVLSAALGGIGPKGDGNNASALQIASNALDWIITYDKLTLDDAISDIEDKLWKIDGELHSIDDDKKWTYGRVKDGKANIEEWSEFYVVDYWVVGLPPGVEPDWEWYKETGLLVY